MNKILIPSSLPETPSSARITGDSFKTAHQALINQYNGWPIFVVPQSGIYNHSELAAYKEKFGDNFILLFDVSHSPNEDKAESDEHQDLFASYKHQTNCKQASDSLDPQLNGVDTKNIPCLYYTGIHSQPAHLLPSLISRAPSVYSVSAYYYQPMDTSSVDHENSSITLKGLSLNAAFCPIDISQHPENAGFYQVNRHLADNLTPYLTHEQGKATPEPCQVIIEVKNATDADQLRIDNTNHELRQKRPLYLNGQWYYGANLSFQLCVNPELALPSFILEPKTFNRDEAQSDIIPMTIGQKTNNISDSCHTPMEVEAPSECDNATVLISLSSKLWQIEEIEDSDYRQFHGKKTPLCNLLETHIKNGESLNLHGPFSGEFHDQLSQYFRNDKLKIHVNGKRLDSGEAEFIHSNKGIDLGNVGYKRYQLQDFERFDSVTHVQGPYALYHCLKDKYQRDGKEQKIAWSLNEWLDNPASVDTIFIDGHNLTLESRGILEALQNGPKQNINLDYQNVIKQLPSCHNVKIQVINPMIPIDGVGMIKVGIDDEYVKIMKRLATTKQTATDESQSIQLSHDVLDSLSVDNYALASKLSTSVTPEGLIKLFSDNRKDLSPFTSKDCIGIKPKTLDGYVNIRPEIPHMIQLLRDCSFEHALGLGVLLTGPPGIGKSLVSIKFAESWGATMNTSANPSSYIIFDGPPRDGDIKRLAEFYAKGGIVIINEFEDPCWQEALDKLKSARDPNKNFFVIASSNFPPSTKTSLPILSQASWNLSAQLEYIKQKLSSNVQDIPQTILAKWQEFLAQSSCENPLGARELDAVYKEWYQEHSHCNTQPQQIRKRRIAPQYLFQKEVKRSKPVQRHQLQVSF